MKRFFYTFILIGFFAVFAVGSVLWAISVEANLSLTKEEFRKVQQERSELNRENVTGPKNPVSAEVVAAWRDHYQTVTSEFENNLTKALRRSGGAITETDNIKIEDRELESITVSYVIHGQRVVGNLSSVLNLVGELEANDPLLRIERIRLSRGGENIECNLSVAIPQINVEGIIQE
jgi:hypothetical protein